MADHIHKVEISRTAYSSSTLHGCQACTLQHRQCHATSTGSTRYAERVIQAPLKQH